MITKKDILKYEVASSCWAGFIFWSWGQELGSKYYGWKVNRKWKRYEYFLKISEDIKKETQNG